MKLFFALLFLAAATRTFGETLNFDDLPTDTGFVEVPNGYGGLNWSNFTAVNGLTDEPANTGYYTGVVSSPNILFDDYARPASVSSSQPFNLDSAWLTGAFNDGLNVEVQGFNGSDLLYDNTYIVDTEGPLLVDFNYIGVTEVVFTPYLGLSEGTSSQFVMDDLTVDVPEPGTISLCLLGTAFAVVGKLRRSQ